MTDGCVHLLFNSSWKVYQLAAGQLLSGQQVRYGKGRRYGPSITYKITPAGSLSSSQPGVSPCWANPLSFVLIDPFHLSWKEFPLAIHLFLLTSSILPPNHHTPLIFPLPSSIFHTAPSISNLSSSFYFLSLLSSVLQLVP
jgi:hypothetical protein